MRAIKDFWKSIDFKTMSIHRFVPINQDYFVFETAIWRSEVRIRGSGFSSSCVEGLQHSKRPLYYSRFYLAEGDSISRIEICKAYGYAKYTVSYFQGLVDAMEAKSKDGSYDKDMLGALAILDEYTPFLDELDRTLSVLYQWETQRFIPAYWLPLPPLPDLTFEPPLPAEQLPIYSTANGENDEPAMTPYFIYICRHLLRLQKQGIDRKWFDLWKELEPDEQLWIYKLEPPDHPVRPWDIALRPVPVTSASV
ncbi:hypothetical protein L202_01888 [Cryptococcus amylolentus CBS 6039]|uniref:Uncharacterized protein n=1 Tax=Cryptococcus amylolentus CBS 6039 TaxID=1295533 RepID=A0A1E3I0W9_9TREE|nr:hypothetical protein L202_01888 [Cryptococcus amylolentus CBS 6039]ODN81461.1 hypothetical protein L202_01888 [Cryptococcus amylolentus CBS 6039]